MESASNKINTRRCKTYIVDLPWVKGKGETSIQVTVTALSQKYVSICACPLNRSLTDLAFCTIKVSAWNLVCQHFVLPVSVGYTHDLVCITAVRLLSSNLLCSLGSFLQQLVSKWQLTCMLFWSKWTCFWVSWALANSYVYGQLKGYDHFHISLY